MSNIVVNSHIEGLLPFLSSSEVAPITELVAFLSLPHGWHFGDGLPASRQAVHAALAMRTVLQASGAQNFEVFPAVDGGVAIAGYNGQEMIEVFCEPEGHFGFLYEIDGEEKCASENLDMKSALALIRKFAWRTENSFVSYTHDTIVESVDPLIASRFKTPQTEAAFLLSTLSVPLKRTRTVADIFENSIPHQNLGIHQYFGASLRPSLWEVHG